MAVDQNPNPSGEQTPPEEPPCPPELIAESIPCLPDKTAEDVTDPELDKIVEDTFPASDPIPVMGTIAPATKNPEEPRPKPPSGTASRAFQPPFTRPEKLGGWTLVGYGTA